jgi:ribonuclease Z
MGREAVWVYARGAFPLGKGDLMAVYTITFLGTMAYRPTESRSLVSTYVGMDDMHLMVDCGEGTQRRMVQAGITLGGEIIVFVSHRHAEHFLGLFGLAITMRVMAPEARLRVFAESETLERLQTVAKALDDRFVGGLTFEPFREGVFYENKTSTLQAFPLQHLVPSFGLVIQQKAHRPFLRAEADRLGVPEGPQRGQLAAGKTVVLESGKVITPDQVLGQEQTGGKIVFISDTRFFPELVGDCQGAMCVVAEATYIEKDQSLAREWGHLTAKEAATIARDAGAHMLLLTHLSGRYSEADILAEARGVFPRAQLCRDLEHIAVDLSPKDVDA